MSIPEDCLPSMPNFWQRLTTFIAVLDYSHGDPEKIREKVHPTDDNLGHITDIWSLLGYVFTRRSKLRLIYRDNFDKRKERENAERKPSIVVRGPPRVSHYKTKRQEVRGRLARGQGTEKQGKLVALPSPNSGQ